MGKPPRYPKAQQPSPLAQVDFARPLSQPPQEMGLVRDPAFWKRFSVAAHRADTELGPTSSIDSKDHWLMQQQQEKRRYRITCLIITLVVIGVIAAGAICGWYFGTQYGKV